MSVIIPTVDAVARPQSQGYDGYIGNLLIRLAVSEESPMEDLTAEATPPRIDTSESAEDVRDETGRRYSRGDLSGGAGLDFLHTPNRPQDAPIRYWDSRGVDVFGAQRGELYSSTLMHRVDATAGTSDVIDVAKVGDAVIYLRSAGLYEYPTTQRATPTSPTQLVALGNSVYVPDASGIGRYVYDATPGTWTRLAYSAQTYDRIWAAKARILGVASNLLYDATDHSVILTLPTDETVLAVVEAGPTILVFTSYGSIIPMSLNADNLLVKAGETKFSDEVPVVGAETFGVVAFATVATNENGGKIARFYTARLALSGNYDLGDVQLIYEVGDRDTTEDLTPSAMYATRESIFCAIKEEGDTAVTLWRYFLPTGGFARSFELATSGSVASLVEANEQLYCAVPSDALYFESDEYVIDGYVIGPAADFYTDDDKQWVSAEVTAATLPTGCALTLYHTSDPDLLRDPDSSNWQLVTALQTGQAQQRVNNIAGFDSRYHAAKVVYASDSSRLFAPRLRSYSFRALPAPQRDLLMRIPINVSDQVERTGRRPIKVKGRGRAIEQALRDYEGEQVLVELYRPQIQMLGLIERFESTITVIPERGHPRRVMYARVRGTQLQDSQAISTQTSGASLGQDLLGVALLGVGEVNT